MEIKTVIKEKSNLLLQLQVARLQKQRRVALDLASRAATLESVLAAHYFDADELSNAVISLNSEASCLEIAERWKEAYRIFLISRTLAGNDQRAVGWINERIGGLSGHLNTAISINAFDRSASILSNPQLRTPQIAAYAAAKDHFSQTNEHAIIQLPVGCGKTGTMAILPFQVSKGRVLVIAPNREICTNLHASLDYGSSKNFWKRTNVLNNGSGPTCAVLTARANIHDCDASDFIVTNIQQLVAKDSAKWLDQFPVDYFDMLFIDEGHHNVAASWQQTIGRFPKSKIVSFTATPIRSDGKQVEGKRIYRFPIASAIREGYIKDIASRRLEPSEIFFTYKGQETRHTLAEVAKLREEDWFSKGVALSPECNKSIVDASIKCMEELRQQGNAKHQIIAAACSIDHANSIRSLYAERGLKADVLHSKLDDDEQAAIRAALENHKIDVIVHVAMLGEGADYPTLSVAAIFRPYRHIVPYVQFVGRIMRVIEEQKPGHPDNQGFVVSHFGLNIDRWWKELKGLDSDDQAFYEEVANGLKEFTIDADEDPNKVQPRRRFKPDMEVLAETIAHIVQSGFLPEDNDAMLNELIEALSLRGFTPEMLGMSRQELEKRISDSQQIGEKLEKHESVPVQPQRAREQARTRLNERVKSGAKQLLNGLGYTNLGRQLVNAARTGAGNNLAAAIILVNKEVKNLLGVGVAERDTLSEQQCKTAHDAMDQIIDTLIEKFKGG